MNVRIWAQRAKEVSQTAVRLLAAIFVSSLFLSALSAQGNSTASPGKESERAAHVRALNNSVLQLHEQLQGSQSGSGGVRGQAAGVLSRRAAALQALIQENPRAALSFAFSPELLEDLGSKLPDSAAQLERHVSQTGTIEFWTTDYPDPRLSKTEVVLRSGSRTLKLHFATQPATRLASGANVQVRGVVSGTEMAVSQVGPDTGASALPFVPSRQSLGGWSGAAPVGYIAVLVCVVLGFMASQGGRLRKQWRPILLKRIVVLVTALAVALLSPSGSVGQTQSCSATGVQNVAVLLVTFPGVTLPANVTTASLQDIFFATNTPGPSLDGFLRDASYGQTSATGNVFGPFTLPGTYGSCTDVSGAVLNDAIAAAVAGGVNLQSYSRIALVFPDTLGCGWAGFGGSSCSVSSSSGNFNASVAYLVANYVGDRAQAVSLASHELGHNLGLLHSGAVNAGSQALGPLAAPGDLSDMGDYWSSMGATVLGTYPAPQKSEVLGWLKPSSYLTVQSSGTYTLQPLETSPAGLQALKIQRGTGNNAWLWVEYRQPIDSYDSTLIHQVFSGALIHYEDSTTVVGHSYLPNFTPTDATGNSPALAAGQSWSDPYSNLAISVQSATSTGLTVSVSYGSTPCSSSAPSVVASPLNPSIYPGQTANYSVAVTNNDSPGCSSSTINLASSEPAGWSTSFSSPSVSLNPGQSATLTMGKGSPNGTPAGTYAVNLNASNNSATVTDTANATVITPPSLAVTASVASSAFSRPGSVPISAQVTSGGAAISGASVTFRITTPNGNGSTQSATTNSSGSATVSYKLGPRSVAGSYSVVVQASLTSGSRKNGSTQTASSSPVTFVVQ